MKTGIDEVVGRGKMIFPVTAVDEGEILQMRIIVERKIVEDNDAEEFQDFYGSRLYILADDVCTFLITQVAVLEIATTVGIGQSCK